MLKHLTTPIPSPEASHSNTNGWEKSEKARTMHELMTSFMFSNVSYVVFVHTKVPLFVRPVRGASNCEYPLTNIL